jgi:hypothetical protein
MCVVYGKRDKYKRLLLQPGQHNFSLRFAPNRNQPQQTTATTGRETSSHARVDVHEKWFSCAHHIRIQAIVIVYAHLCMGEMVG